MKISIVSPEFRNFQWQKLLEIQQIQMDFMKELMHRSADDRTAK